MRLHHQEAERARAVKQEKREQCLKEIELKLLSELMKNSRRSDRELAKVLGVSQPTVSRTIRKLEEKGIIREYTMIPDFSKTGYHLMALTFAKFHEKLTSEQLEKAKSVAQERLAEIGQAILLERGIGLNSNGVVVSLHKDYSSFLELHQWLRQFPFLGSYDVEAFIINLDDEVHYRYLTFSTLANHLLTMNEKRDNAVLANRMPQVQSNSILRNCSDRARQSV